ncbi:15896_t:CDS:2 [Rhizophagus irregularis]|nr:15896_t:CDS:2 [Rhizophagus irregularis]
MGIHGELTDPVQRCGTMIQSSRLGSVRRCAKKCSVAFIKNVYIEKTHKVILYFRNEQDMKKVKESGFIQTKAYFKLD